MLRQAHARMYPFMIAFLMVFLIPSMAWAKTPNFTLVRPLITQPAGSQAEGQPSFILDSWVAYGLMWSFVFTVNRGLGGDIQQANLGDLWKHIQTRPQWPDGDGFVTNFIGHPLFGASIYQFYRLRGHAPMKSFAGTFLQSTLFEYTIEGFKEPPSGVDLITTPLLGSLLGQSLRSNVLLLGGAYAVGKYIVGWF